MAHCFICRQNLGDVLPVTVIDTYAGQAYLVCRKCNDTILEEFPITLGTNA